MEDDKKALLVSYFGAFIVFAITFGHGWSQAFQCAFAYWLISSIAYSIYKKAGHNKGD